MIPFSYARASSPDQAIALAAKSSAKYLGGGTNLVDLMKDHVETPTTLIDVSRLPFNQIKKTDSGGVLIGAAAKNTETANHELIRTIYPVLSQAILAGATMQLRNMATNGGNLLQRTRCYYFRDTDSPCNKRTPGSGCSALNGFNRNCALFGTSDDCIATHPSDMCVALVALDAVIHCKSAKGDRTIPINNFYVPYGENPAKENVLLPGELITGIELPAISYSKRSSYLKLRDRASYEFALASAAVILDFDGKKIRAARIGLGGIASKPWRATEAEASLAGQQANADSFKRCADLAVKGAVPRKDNAFKIELARRAIVRALEQTAAIA